MAVPLPQDTIETSPIINQSDQAGVDCGRTTMASEVRVLDDRDRAISAGVARKSRKRPATRRRRCRACAGRRRYFHPRGMMRPVAKVPKDGYSPIERSTMSEQTTKALPIVLIHGLWMTARSWDRWAQYYRAKGHEVVVPS